MTLNVHAAPSEESNIQIVPAKFLKKLVDIIGAPKAGPKLGYSASAINEAMRDGKCRLTLELAAEFVWMRDYGLPGDKPMTAIVQVRGETMKAIAHVVAVAGGTLQEIKDLRG